jgi:murein DD-endopeptidase MepM/ murein hydrolase activator NlpD
VVAGFDAPAGPYAAGHRGVDLSAVVGQEVLAAAAGTVAFAGTVAGRGVVSVDHADGRRTTYEPVTPSVRAGDPVAAGAVLGRVGTAPGHCLPTACLHWGVRRGEEYEDPLRLLGAAPVRLLPVWGSTWTLPPAGAAPVPRDGPEVEVGPAGRPERGPLLAGLGTGGWSEQ